MGRIDELVEAQTTFAHLRTQHMILFLEIDDHIHLLAIDPAGQADQQQLPWVKDQTHRGIVTASGSFTTDQIATIGKQANKHLLLKGVHLG